MAQRRVIEDPLPKLGRLTIRTNANKDGTITGRFFHGPLRYLYDAMYLPELQTMTILRLQVEVQPRNKLPFWRRVHPIHGSRLRLALVQRLNEELEHKRKLHKLTLLPRAKPKWVGG